MAAIDLEDIKRGLRIDNAYSDELIQTYIDSAVAALSVTVGPTQNETEAYGKLKKTYVQEYVRSLFFEVNTTRICNALQMQMQALNSIQEEETLD